MHTIAGGSGRRSFLRHTTLGLTSGVLAAGTRPLIDRRSGDGSTPAGVFPLGTVTGWDGQSFSTFGNAVNPGVRANMPYRQVRPQDCWGATPNTPAYNHLVDRPNCAGPDDEWLPNKLARQIPMLHEDPAVGVVGCANVVWRGDGRHIRTRFFPNPPDDRVERMRQIVDSALPGVPLRQTPTPPPQIRVIPGYVYFELDRGSPDWQDFSSATGLGLHVAGNWPQLQLELWCVKRSAR